MAKKSQVSLDGLRQVFPQECKWYTPEVSHTQGQAEVEAEVLKRSKRLQEQGVSPCVECPLCPGEHGH